MSSQASSAGHGEKDVRRKIVETGDVDVMIAIRSNFFYTRTVPCELWFFSRAKPKDQRDNVLMLDARGVYRKVNRKIYDFSPEQLNNLSAIVWLYRGERERFLSLVKDYFADLCRECAAVPNAVAAFDKATAAFVDHLTTCAQFVENLAVFAPAVQAAPSGSNTTLFESEQTGSNGEAVDVTLTAANKALNDGLTAGSATACRSPGRMPPAERSMPTPR
jgi:type I restriction enzyme M protein